MTDSTIDILKLDAAYRPFPTFEQWSAHTKIDSQRWDRYKSSLETYSDLPQHQLNRAREIAKRAVAIDTGALEDLYEVDRGFTFTVAFETAAWESALVARGEQVRPLFEAQLHAYDYVLDLATRAEPITEAAIRALHEEVVRAQSTYLVTTAVGPQEQPLPKGQYKSQPNHVRTRKGTNHSYAPVDVTPPEMARLVNELRSETFLNAHPIQQASYVHYAFVLIHPFADGNGRVARALASAFTYRAVSIPIVILSEHKTLYLDSLEAADGGNYQSFGNFMLDRSLETIQLVEESLRGAKTPNLENTLKEMQSLYVTSGGYSHDQVDQAGILLLDVILKALQKVAATNKIPKLSTNINIVGANVPANLFNNSTHQGIGTGARALQIVSQLQSPVPSNILRQYFSAIPIDAHGSDDILLRDLSRDTFTARIDEIIPSLSGSLQIRIEMFAERVIGELLAELLAQAKKTLGR